jgi:hypothetical protein
LTVKCDGVRVKYIFHDTNDIGFGPADKGISSACLEEPGLTALFCVEGFELELKDAGKGEGKI